MNRRADIPFFVVMMAYVLIGLAIMLLIYLIISGKLSDWFAWLFSVV
ncbi:MAG: hypothetical protein QXK37_02250 [Candidatus Woesearchaeota archaeon]